MVKALVLEQLVGGEAFRPQEPSQPFRYGGGVIQGTEWVYIYGKLVLCQLPPDILGEARAHHDDPFLVREIESCLGDCDAGIEFHIYFCHKNRYMFLDKQIKNQQTKAWMDKTLYGFIDAGNLFSSSFLRDHFIV